jgi:hypothetical protein
MRRIVLTFGLISGAIISIMMAATVPFIERIGYDRGQVIGYTSMVVAFLLIFFGIRSYRDNVAGGSIGFRRAFAVGSLIALVASLCYVATWQVVHRTVAQDFMTKYQAHAIEQARARGDSPAEVEKQRAEMERFAELYKNPAINAAVTLLEPLPVGLVIALLSAAALRRRSRGGVATEGVVVAT